MTKTYHALTIAKYFLSIPDEDSGELVSNLKIQKLLYYAQGYWLGLNGEDKPLFKDKMYAWKHGPVTKTVYDHYSSFGKKSLPKENQPDQLEEDYVHFLNEIYRTYGKFSAWVLRDMTHKEAPWLNNYEPEIMDIEIPFQDLENFFKDKIKVSRAQ